MNFLQGILSKLFALSKDVGRGRGLYGLCLRIFGLPFNNPNQLVEKYMEELILKVVEWLDSGLTNYVLYNHPIHIPPLKHFQ